MAKLVGILNITPDSFSDGGQFTDMQAALNHAAQLFEEGAHLVDIGAESTRPNATPLSDDEEWQRLESVLKVLLQRYPGKISLDSYHPTNIKRAFALGPIIVNDVTGFNNPDMVEVVAALKPTVIISHLPNMSIQEAHQTMPATSMEQVKSDLLDKAKTLQSKGLERQQIILDPGIGFGKTMELNKKLLRFAKQALDFRVMIGYSRKRFLGEHRMELEPNLAAGKTAIDSGAHYLRVHDVRGHMKLLA